MSKILVLNGPNLNLLGEREPEIYGKESLLDVEATLQELSSKHNMSIKFIQSNAEHEIIDSIQNSKTENTKFIIINPGPLTHTSIAIRDTFLSVQFLLLKFTFPMCIKEKNSEKNLS